MDEALEEFESKSDADFEALDIVMEKLKKDNQRQYLAVVQGLFSGLAVKGTAQVLDMSESSVDRDWRLARAKLYAQLRQCANDS
jgi:DNA-directed RNA polymerase specialized sigma24 family protein